MTDHQKIHPSDVEAAPTAPLVKHDSLNTTTEQAIPVQQFPPQQRRTIPVSHSKPPKKRGCCCKCFCWTVSLLLILLILIAATGGILYLVFRPKVPKFTVNSLRVSNLQLDSNNTISAAINVTITARNPNKKIGIYYKDGSYISVWYGSTRLCDGSLPVFYQGHRNTTILTVPLAGQIQYGSTLMIALEEQQQTGSVPLDLKAKVPVRIKFGRLKLRKVKFNVRCKLVVGNLTGDNNLVSVRTSSCKFKLKL